MAYEKQNFLDGQIVTADHLNHMENGIVAAQNPRNLLDNSDFRIAQAGYGGMHGTQKYACDRWYDTYGFGSFSFNESEGLTIAYGTNHAYLVQKINDASLLHGKTVTLAMQLSDGSVYAKSGVFVSDGASFIIDIATDKTLTLFSDRVEFVVTSGSMTIKWAALYEGSYTADTLPPYVPRGYAEELAECQRYYYKTVGSNWDGSVCNAIGSNAYAPLYITYPVPMRITPTVSNGVSSCDVFGTGSVSASITNASVDRWHYACMATVSSSHGGKIIKPIGAVEFSADL